MKNPVALLIFKRPDTTAKVFETIRQAQPPKLLIVADGPRLDRPGEAERCMATRAVVENVDWDCEVIRNYSDVNLGCGIRPATGITWVFEQVEEAIILEDDCLPHPTFFQFCDELLERYRDDERIMLISGTNHFKEWKPSVQSYHFSQLSATWGWASWRRAWKFFDYEIKLFPEAVEAQFLKNVFSDSKQRLHWENHFRNVCADDNKSYWDYQWLFTRWIQSGLGIFPSVNLISNIGIGADATHTFEEDHTTNLETKALEFPLKHPPFIVRDNELDDLIQKKIFSSSLQSRVVAKSKRLIRKVIARSKTHSEQKQR